MYRIECGIAANPNPLTNRRDGQDKRYAGWKVRMVSSSISWEDACQRVFDHVQSVRETEGKPRAVLESAGCQWAQYDEEVQTTVRDILRTKYPDVIVSVGPEYGVDDGITILIYKNDDESIFNGFGLYISS